jgi:transcriptional regulator with XRE-family HTH domain
MLPAAFGVVTTLLVIVFLEHGTCLSSALIAHSATASPMGLPGVNLPRYSARVTQDDDWPARMARLVAREVRRHRDRRKMSAQQLADRTASLGMGIPRSVLANLESGRRDTVAVAEVLVLAAALGVAPVELFCPAGFDEEIEILPGRPLDPLLASRWVDGELQIDLSRPGTAPGSWRPT